MQKPCDAENSAECEGDYKQNWTNKITRTTLTNETSEHNSPKYIIQSMLLNRLLQFYLN